MEQSKKLNMTSMSSQKNSNIQTEKEEPVWEHRIAMPDTIIWF